MRNLLNKELRLSINRFFYVLPLLLALLMFIPQWIYIIVFMYFFWIPVTNIYSSYLAQEDYSFIAMLPVSKKDVVVSKIYAFNIIELLHIILGFAFGIAHNLIYGNYNFFLDVNYAMFGIVILMFGIFNICYLPYYFKTAYFFGKPVIFAITVTLLYAFLVEFLNIRFEAVNNIFEGPITTQLIVLVVGAIFAVVLNHLAIKLSIKNYENID